LAWHVWQLELAGNGLAVRWEPPNSRNAHFVGKRSASAGEQGDGDLGSVKPSAGREAVNAGSAFVARHHPCVRMGDAIADRALLRG